VVHSFIQVGFNDGTRCQDRVTWQRPTKRPHRVMMPSGGDHGTVPLPTILN
jgi:hypothetical protein